MDNAMTECTEFKGASITQTPINMNNVTTGHKLQEVSKNKLIVVSWSFVPSWIYIWISRVHTFKGLYLLKLMPKIAWINFKSQESCRHLNDVCADWRML